MNRVTVEEFMVYLNEVNLLLKNRSEFECILYVDNYIEPVLYFKWEGYRPNVIYYTNDLTDMYHYIKGMIKGIERL